MLSKKIWVACASLLIVGSSLVIAADPKLDGVKCLLQPTKAANAAKAAEWKKGKVYFCCDNCLKAFSENKEKNAAKANAQLVATKQYKQEACPLSGGKLDDSTAIEVGGAKVAFCCNNCKGKAEAAKDAEKLDMVFGEKAFEKAKFTLVEDKK